jgi:hypothetical protein
MTTNNNNKNQIPLGQRDLQLFQLEQEIRSKRELLIKKKNELTNKNKMNEFLTGVKEDYTKYYNYILQEKQQQLSALMLLKEYMNDLVKTEKNVELQTKKAKYDQEDIELELNKVKEELDNLLKSGTAI